MDRGLLIERIIQEKGRDAIPALFDLLINEDDDTAQICFEALLQMGSDVVPELIERLWVARRDPVAALYLVDLAGEIGDSRLINPLYNLLKEYSDEKSQTIIYESLAKLGEGEKVVGILSLFLEESEEQDFRDQIIMALSQTASPEAVTVLARQYGDEMLDKSGKAFILEAIHMLLSSNLELKDVLLNLSNGNEILERLYLWQREI
jgi:HEAT repeat protein